MSARRYHVAVIQGALACCNEGEPRFGGVFLWAGRLHSSVHGGYFRKHPQKSSGRSLESSVGQERRTDLTNKPRDAGLFTERGIRSTQLR